MQDKLRILEDLNMLYIRQIALSLQVGTAPGLPGPQGCQGTLKATRRGSWTPGSRLSPWGSPGSLGP